MEDRDKVLDKVRKLLAKAASTDSDPEAAALTAKADQIMYEHMIQEHELRSAHGADSKRVKPELRTIELGDRRGSGVFSTILQACARHYGCIPVEYTNYNSAIKIFGYESDLDFTELLFTHLSMQMVKELFPSVDRDRPEKENVYYLRMAGYRWADIMSMIYPEQNMDESYPEVAKLVKSTCVKYTKWFKEECDRRGVTRPVITNPAEYRRQFIAAFANQISYRLQMLRREQEENTRGALVLVGRDSDLKEAFYEMFPDRRPHARGCDCDQCHYCENAACARCKKYRGRGIVRSNRRGPQVNMNAVNAGVSAANRADLMQGKVGTGRAGELT